MTRGIVPQEEGWGVAEPSESCTHPWLRVTCGVCNEAVDVLGQDQPDRPGEVSVPRPPGSFDPQQQLFIVARGHPELVEEIKSVMGHAGVVRIIEDRRSQPRVVPPPEDDAREIRKRLREDDEG